MNYRLGEWNKGKIHKVNWLNIKINFELSKLIPEKIKAININFKILKEFKKLKI